MVIKGLLIYVCMGSPRLSLVIFRNYSVLYVLLGYFKIEDWLLQITCQYSQGCAGTWSGAKLYFLYRPVGLPSFKVHF